MAFTYTTEYYLGRRGRVNRAYSGIQALIAISFDLALGFTFGLIGLTLWLIRGCCVTTYRFAISLFALPFKAVRSMFAPHPDLAVAKPAWALFDEL